MGTESTPAFPDWQGQIVPVRRNRIQDVRDTDWFVSNRSVMDVGELDRDQWRLMRIERLEAAIGTMGWSRTRFRSELKKYAAVAPKDESWKAWWKPGNNRFPSDYEFAKIAAFLGLSLDWLAGIQRWSREAIHPHKAFAAAILNQARQMPEAFPSDPLDMPEPQKKAA